MSFHRTLTLTTHGREEMVEITTHVAKLVAVAGLTESLVTVFVPHTTAGVTINENADAAVQSDMLAWLRHLVPAAAGFRHAEGNSDAHIKATLVGSSAQVPVAAGRMLLGRWQGIYFAEFDGPRRRTVEVIVR